MKDLIIIGAGGMGRDITWMIERINEAAPTWNVLGFVDDDEAMQGKVIADRYPVLGTIAALQTYTGEVYVACGIAGAATKRKVMERVMQQKNLRPATLIDPSAIISRTARVGEGSIIAAGAILAFSACLGAYTIVHLNCTVGHETVLEEYCTVYPGSNLSGCVRVGSCTEIGTGTKITQGLSVCSNCVLGAGAVVVRDITEPGTYVGVPVKKVK